MKVSMRLQRSILRGIFAALTTLACAPLARAGSSSLYVQDGLLACWDGIENAGEYPQDNGDDESDQGVLLGTGPFTQCVLVLLDKLLCNPY